MKNTGRVLMPSEQRRRLYEESERRRAQRFANQTPSDAGIHATGVIDAEFEEDDAGGSDLVPKGVLHGRDGRLIMPGSPRFRQLPPNAGLQPMSVLDGLGERICKLESELEELKRTKANVEPETKTVSVMLLGKTYNAFDHRSSKQVHNWTFTLQRGEVVEERTSFMFAFASGAWLRGLNGALLSEVCVGDRLCTVPSGGGRIATMKAGPRVRIPEGILLRQELIFTVTAAW